MVLRLEVFDSDAASRNQGTDTVILDTEALEEARLAAYESGYTAGWEDAAAAQSDDSARMTSEVARNLQSLSFTYHEARVHVLKAIEPLLAELVGRVLPAVARESLAPLVLETLMPLAEGMAETPVSLVLNPQARLGVESLLESMDDLPVTLVEEPTLGEGQVYVKLGDVEREIDLDRAVGEILAAVRGFFELTGKD